MKLRASVASIGTAAVLATTSAFLLPAAASTRTVTHTLKFTSVQEATAGFGKTTEGAEDKDINTTRQALSPDSGLAGCAAVAGTHQVAADYPAIGAQFASSRWPDLRFSGMAYVEIATKLLTTTHAYGGETAWFYQRLSAACAKHGRALPF
jgi:hypothetical protein